MNINPGDIYLRNKLTNQLSRIEKNLENKVILNKEIDVILMLGNGDVDDYVMAIISYRLNHTKTIGLMKPKNKKKYDITFTPRLRSGHQSYPQRCDTVEMIPVYFKITNKMALVMDQENESIDSIIKRCEKKLSNLGVNIKNKREIADKIIHYQCSYISKKLDFILIINGLSELDTEFHKMEDHLIKMAIKLNKINSDSIEDSKKTWRNLSDLDKNDILRDLLYSRYNSLHETFSQHCEGLKLLKELE